MQNKKKIYTILYIAAVSAFLATLTTYNLPSGIKNFSKNFLPIRAVKKINFTLSSNPIDFSTLTIGFIGVLITVGIVLGISLIFFKPACRPPAGRTGQAGGKNES